MLARALSRRTSQLVALAPCCTFRCLSQDVRPSSGDPVTSNVSAEDDAPSTSASASLGWLRGPESNKPNKSLLDEWEEVRDAATGSVAWRSVLTGETTVPGAPKPDTWNEVVDKKTGLIYYWCKRTGDTTVLGEPKPGPYGRKAHLDQEELEGGEGGREGGGGRGGRSRGGGGEGGSGGGPSLMGLVTNPLVIGVSVVAALAIAYETMIK